MLAILRRWVEGHPGPKTVRQAVDDWSQIITDRVLLDISPNPENVRYLETKRERLGHMLPSEEAAGGVASEGSAS